MNHQKFSFKIFIFQGYSETLRNSLNNSNRRLTWTYELKTNRLKVSWIKSLFNTCGKCIGLMLSIQQSYMFCSMCWYLYVWLNFMLNIGSFISISLYVSVLFCISFIGSIPVKIPMMNFLWKWLSDRSFAEKIKKKNKRSKFSKWVLLICYNTRGKHIWLLLCNDSFNIY